MSDARLLMLFKDGSNLAQAYPDGKPIGIEANDRDDVRAQAHRELRTWGGARVEIQRPTAFGWVTVETIAEDGESE